jgi:hypothetical protein
MQPIAPRSPVRRRRAERGIRHFDHPDRATRIERVLESDPLRTTADRQIPTGVDDDIARSVRDDDVEDAIDQATLAQRADVDHRRFCQLQPPVRPRKALDPLRRRRARAAVDQSVGRVVPERLERRADEGVDGAVRRGRESDEFVEHVSGVGGG